jgi:LPS-assembly lipoprotein
MLLNCYFSRRNALAAFAAAVVSACGFRPRGAVALPFSSLGHGFAESSLLGRDVQRSLQGNGAAVFAGADRSKGAVQLDVLIDQREKSVASLNASGQVREFQLRLRLKFRLRTKEGRDLIEDTELLATRDISFNETAVLAKEAEEQLLYRDMQSDVVQQLLRRLAAVKMPG